MGLEPEVSTTNKVESFNEEFHRRRQELGDHDPDDMKRLWVNIGLTAPGLLKITGDPDRMATDLGAFPVFTEGAAAAAERLGDTDKSAPGNWHFGSASEVDAIVIVAADDPGELESRVQEITAAAQSNGVEMVFLQEGETLPPPLQGHEHFGFKDGISQPAVRDFHVPDPARPQFRMGKSERLTAPGEFVLGYEDASGQVQPCPEWMRDGSFQILRRLNQDVAGWNQQITQRAAEAALEEPAMGAKAVGRWASGAPLAVAPNNDDGNATNEFVYEDDPEGHSTPRFAHIRKTFPRTERFDEDHHRIMRRGIPFGPAFGQGSDDAERGLVFNIYCADIGDQFEFMQASWANNPGFQPGSSPPDGTDPVIGIDGSVTLRTTDKAPQQLHFQRFVITRGAAYAFAPSKSALRRLAAGEL